MAGKDPHSLKEGQEVAWKWGSQKPTGTVKEVRDEDTQVKTKKGSTITKSGSKDDPVIVAETSNGNVAAKNVSRSRSVLRCKPILSDTIHFTVVCLRLPILGFRGRWRQALSITAFRFMVGFVSASLGNSDPHSQLVLCASCSCQWPHAL